MSNKTIAIVDINDWHKQNIELLIFASVLEKKVNNLCVFDLNAFNNSLLPPKGEFKKSDDILSTNIFSNTLYHICAKAPTDQEKMLNLIKNKKKKCDIVLINTNKQQSNYNSQFYSLADEIVIFANLEKNTNNILNFFLKHNIKDKKVHLVIHNYKLNIQDEKLYLQILKQFHHPNIKITNIDAIPNLPTLSSIENIDPWHQIYKFIKSQF